MRDLILGRLLDLLCLSLLLGSSMVSRAEGLLQTSTPISGVVQAEVYSTRIAVPGNMFANLEKGAVSGIFAETLDVLLRTQGYRPSYLTMSTSDALRDLAEGTVGVATVVVPVSRIQEAAYFSDPIVTEYNVAVALKGKGFNLTRIADLNDKRIGARTGYQYPLLEKASGLQISRFQSDGEMMRALLFGQIDVAVISAISDVYAFRAEGIMTRLEVLKMALGSVPLVAAFSKRQFSREQVDAFNRALAEFRLRPEWQTILERNGVADLLREWPVVAE